MKLNSNDPLSEVLKTWRVNAPLPPGFERDVWQRIDGSLRSSHGTFWGLIAHWIAHVLPRPALAASYIAALLLIGVGAGWGRAQQESARVKGELGARYVQALDPYLSGR